MCLSGMSRLAHHFSPARDRREDRDLVGVADRIAGTRRLTVDPHLRPGQHGGEVLSVPVAGSREHRRDVGARNIVSAAPRGLAGSSEET